jgi:hypothetical protein
MATTLLDQVNSSIEATSNDPTLPLNQRALEEAELVLSETLSPPQRQQLVASLSALLPSLHQDPTPAVNLLLRLLHVYRYADILSLGSIPFTDGLAPAPHMVAYNRLILSILQKATQNASDAALVAGMLDTVVALVRLWLSTDDPGIASQCSQLLLDLLKVDQELRLDPDAHLPAGGQGLVWKRIFGDRHVYGTFYDLCSSVGPTSANISKSQRTISQSRLLEWLPKVAGMDWNAVCRSHHPDIEAEYGVRGGLLDFASLHMVDTSDDVLMYQCLVHFYSDILDATKQHSVGTGSGSEGISYLVSKGVHAKTAAIYLQAPGTKVDPLEAVFLYGPAANYIATYASNYPDHFLASELLQQVIGRLESALDLSAAKWAHAESPKHDLHLLASLPRRALLATSGGGNGQTSPLTLLPSKATNPDVLNTLATIFHGPPKDITIASPSDMTAAITNTPTSEAAEARALYYGYLSNNPRFWSDITTHADTVALKDLALAAINVLTSVITANWSTTPEVFLPSQIATPASGHLALLAPPALEYAIPYLLKPPRTFANLVGGRGDAESAVYKVASAKFDALTALHARLQSQVEKSPGEGYEDILATLSKRLAEGPLSREGEIGSRVETLQL